MTNQPSPAVLPTPLTARTATLQDRESLERIWQLFRHEMSRFSGTLPDADGSYRRERLQAGLTDSAWRPWLLTAGEHPIGFALVRA